uniref:Copine domain-containing protein n=1 Tax=Globodera pallida TaxID=36090 RepID=A0A183BI62_GLOPA
MTSSGGRWRPPTRVAAGDPKPDEPKPGFFSTRYPKPDPRHQKKNGGTFELCRLHEVCTPSFLEYISAGTSLNLAFAIDFSRSGIFVDEQLVKHYIEDVELLIGAFGGALRDFNSSNSYPAFGFGAKIPPQFRESQEFCLNLDGTDPYCRGVSGVFSAFKSSFTKVEPLNMAHLSHVIYYMAKLAQNSLCRLTPANNCVEELGSEGKPPNYFLLVIVTRGIFDDLKEI